MAYENFTTYTEVDSNSHVTVGANQIEHDAYRNEDAYVYDDKGSGHFSNFEHLVHAQVVSGEGGSRGAWWALANEVDDLYALQYSATSKALYVICIYDGWETYVTLGYANNGSLNQDTYHTGIDGNVSYYLTIDRSSTTLTCEIRTGSHSGSLVDTLTVTSVTTDTFRYVYGSNTINDSNTEMIGMQVNNLDLQETNISDTIGITDSLAFTSNKYISDTVGITDFNDIPGDTYTYDTTSISDSVSFASALAKSIADALAISDSIELESEMKDAQSDIVDISDELTSSITAPPALAFTISQKPEAKFAYLYPNGSGCTISSFAIGCTDGYKCVDDAIDILTADDDYVYMDGASTVSDTYSIENHGTLLGTINYIKGCCRAKSDEFPPAYNFDYRILLSEDSNCASFALSRCMPLSTGFTTFENSWLTNPFTATTWNWEDIDKLQVGVQASSPSVVVSPFALLPIENGSRINITDVTTGYEHWDAVSANRPLTEVYETGSSWKYDLYKFTQESAATHYSVAANSTKKYGDYLLVTSHSTGKTYIYKWINDRAYFLDSASSGGYVSATDGNNHYITPDLGKILVYTFNPSNNTLTKTQTVTYDGSETCYSTVYYDGYFYVPTRYNLRVYKSTNGVLSQVTADTRNFYSVEHDGRYIYAATSSTLYAFTFDGTTLTELDSIALGATAEMSIACSNSGDIFVACGLAGIKAYSFDGSTFTFEDSIDNGRGSRVAYSNGYVFECDTSANKLRANSYINTTLAHICNYSGTLGSIYSFAADGNLVTATAPGANYYPLMLRFNGNELIKLADLHDSYLPKYLSGNIVSVSVIAKMGKEYSAAEEAAIRGRATIKTHDTEYPMSDYWTLEYPKKWYSHTWTTNPNTSTAWTIDEVAALEAGVGLYGDGSKFAACSMVQLLIASTDNVSPQIQTSQSYLKINYSPPIEAQYLNIPNAISTTHTENVNMLNFWNGKREVYGVNRSGKSTVLSGSEFQSIRCNRGEVHDRISNVRAMAKRNAEVSISGLPYDGLYDKTYRIRSFGWNKVSDNPIHINWILELEETTEEETC